MTDYSLAGNPLFDALKDAERVLLAGAGGGFDVYSALPLYFALRDQGKAVFLANYSFSALDRFKARRLCEGCYEINAESSTSTVYHPELSLARYLESLGIEASVYSFSRMGTGPFHEAYQRVVAELDVDSVVLVDGGTDILMRGDESSLGTPTADITSLVSVARLGLPRLYLACLGFGVDAFHGVNHYQFLENVAALTREGGFVGVFSVHPEMPAGQRYMAAVDFANQDMAIQKSIVCNSIKSALEGHYGDYHATPRTMGSELWINPLMTLYWCFELKSVFARCLYKDAVLRTETVEETQRAIYQFRNDCAKREGRNLPL